MVFFLIVEQVSSRSATVGRSGSTRAERREPGETVRMGDSRPFGSRPPDRESASAMDAVPDRDGRSHPHRHAPHQRTYGTHIKRTRTPHENNSYKSAGIGVVSLIVHNEVLESALSLYYGKGSERDPVRYLSCGDQSSDVFWGQPLEVCQLPVMVFHRHFSG